MSSLRETLLVGGIVVSLVVLGCRPHGPGGEPARATVVAPQAPLAGMTAKIRAGSLPAL